MTASKSKTVFYSGPRASIEVSVDGVIHKAERGSSIEVSAAAAKQLSALPGWSTTKPKSEED